ncbi:glycosyltransferase family 4 protein [Acinetobacter sp. 256-1]|nr:glycosyltransferase family 4 protein [Acinetobacter sp. 256-1]
MIHTHGIRPDLYTKIHKFDNFLISTQHNVIYDEYIINNSFLKTKAIESIWKFALTNKDLVISIGGAANNYYLKLLPNNRIINVPNGRTIANNQGYGCSEEDVAKINVLKERYTCIGTCTRAIKRKGHAQIIQALPNLPDFCFVLIGDGDYIEFLKKLAHDLRVDDRCLFLGYRKNATAYLNLFDIYAQTSYTESISIALLEAAAAKKAVVCSSIPSNIDVFQENEVVFFNLDDINSLTQAFLKAQRDKERLEINIYKKYEAEYTSEVMIEKYYNLYKDLTNEI